MGARKTASDPENQIRPLQEPVHGFRNGPAAGAKRKRMVLRKGALPAEAGGDRRFQKFREIPQGLPGLGVVDALPRVNYGPLRVQQHGCRHGNRVRIGTGSQCRNGTVAKRSGDLLVENVGWKLHQHRTGASVSNLRKCPSHDLRNGLRKDDLLGKLRDMPVIQRGVEIRLYIGQLPGITHR